MLKVPEVVFIFPTSGFIIPGLVFMCLPHFFSYFLNMVRNNNQVSSFHIRISRMPYMVYSTGYSLSKLGFYYFVKQ